MNTESVHYDEKNGLWRTNELVMTGDDSQEKSIGKDYIDPWVYEFSDKAIADIKYDTSRASTPKATA